MNEEQKISQQIQALVVARGSLPDDDIDSFRQISAMINDLFLKLNTVSANPQIPLLTAQQTQALAQAQDALTNAVNASAGAQQILQAATALANL